jgi:excinuclease ABC subunit C
MNDAQAETAFDPRRAAAALPQRPGVYRMLDTGQQVLYVGKAKNLRRRVGSYFSGRAHNARIQSMVDQVGGIDVTVTATEAEALLLESTLIKQHRPRYNVLLRDDKSYPYVYVSTEHTFPRLAFHRGARDGAGRYFGPYPSAGAVRQTLSLLQKLFRIRPCEDAFFEHRSRPCLQHQIKRCTAPCVGKIDPEAYAADVAHAIAFLEGHTERVIEDLVGRMEAASARLEFEEAARVRDQIDRLRKVAVEQHVAGENGDVDLIACALEAATACVQVFFVRAGQNLGNKAFFLNLPDDLAPGAVLASFVAQYYGARELPPELLLNTAPEEAELLAEALSLQAGRRVRLSWNLRGPRARWMEMAQRNARLALGAQLATRSGLARRYEALQEALDLPETPTRMECFDISHTQGEATVAACVVFDAEGPAKADYRRYNIEGVRPGDDYAAMRQALERRYLRLRKGEGRLPDLLFIDGGKGQVTQAREVLQELQIDEVTIIGIAKGEERRPGLETLVPAEGGAPVQLASSSPALHLIQQIRDEAHRFAITGHRQRRARSRQRSSLEEISGLGPKRRQTLLKHFGGLRGVGAAGVEDLSKVPGISRQLAERIYARLHEGGTAS